MNERYTQIEANADCKVYKATVNLDRLWTLVPEEVREKYFNKENETAPVINTVALVAWHLRTHANIPGFIRKSLEKGRLQNTPVVVKARYVSRKAELKMKEAGGVIEMIA